MGHAPLGAILRQVVVVQNVLEDSDIVFKWRIPSFWGSDGMIYFMLNFQPFESPPLRVFFELENPRSARLHFAQSSFQKFMTWRSFVKSQTRLYWLVTFLNIYIKKG